MVFNVNKQWVFHNLHRESNLNKYDHRDQDLDNIIYC